MQKYVVRTKQTTGVLYKSCAIVQVQIGFDLKNRHRVDNTRLTTTYTTRQALFCLVLHII